MGQVDVRPELIDVMWVHQATAYAKETRSKAINSKTVFLMHFKSEHIEKYNAAAEGKWLPYPASFF